MIRSQKNKNVRNTFKTRNTNVLPEMDKGICENPIANTGTISKRVVFTPEVRYKTRVVWRSVSTMKWEWKSEDPGKEEKRNQISFPVSEVGERMRSKIIKSRQ